MRKSNWLGGIAWVLSACGGSAFQLGPAGDGGDSSPVDVGAAPPEGAADAATQDAASLDSSPGARGDSSGAGSGSSSGGDSSPPAETGPTCTIYSAPLSYCTVQSGTVPEWFVQEAVTVDPGNNIVVDSCSAVRTPDACKCMESYTCACIRARAACPSAPAVGCIDGPVVALQCPQ